MRLKAILLLCLFAPAAFAQVMINEFLYDTQGGDDMNIMFVEIYGPSGTSLTGWTLVGTNGNGGTPYITLDLSGTIPNDGYFVVGGAGTSNVDQVLPHDLQNAGSTQNGDDCDGLELHNSGGTLVDNVCYGICAAGHICDGEGGTNAPDYNTPPNGPNKTVARIPDHMDTNDNAADWVVSDVISPGEPNSGEPCSPINAFLEDVRENDNNGVSVLDGQFVIVRGIVNVNNYVFDDSTSNFYIQDDNAGCNVFAGGVPQGLMEGDCVEVSAWVSAYQGLTELYSSGAGNCVYHVEDLGSQGTISPTILTSASSFEPYEGMLAEIRNVTIVSGTWPTGPDRNEDLTITDGNGTFSMRIDRDTGVWAAGQPSGTFTVRGIITQFDNTSPYTDGYQIAPRYISDLMTGSAVGDDPVTVAESFTLTNAYPNPFNGIANIELSIGNAREIELTITDVLGREVYSRALTNLTPGIHRVQWSPTGAAGLYFVRASSGVKVETTKLLYLK